ncbi:hypothetical protein GmHk_08G023317 [Glycine max]|nr:hypothetical protein GmHk_08G023317 [Glycine max]
MTNRTTILEEAFNLEVPIRLPLMKLPGRAKFVKRPDNHQVGARPKVHQEEQHRNHEADRRRDRAEDPGRQRY